MSEIISLRPATVQDVRDIARIFLAGVALSLPHRNLAELYDYERDIVEPNGQLWGRIMTQLKEETVLIAEDSGKMVGYASWTEPKIAINEATVTREYTPGEITFIFLDPSVHGRGLGSRLIKHIQFETSSVLRRLHLAGELDDIESRTNDIVALGLFCFTLNEPGIRAYKRRGFVPMSTKIHEPSQEELTWMEWIQKL